MHITIRAVTFPEQMTGVSDGSVAGTHFYDEARGAELVPPGVTVQQEDMSAVRIRFAQHYGVRSFVMRAGDTVAVNSIHET